MPLPKFLDEMNIPYRHWLSVAQEIQAEVSDMYSYKLNQEIDTPKFDLIKKSFTLTNQ